MYVTNVWVTSERICNDIHLRLHNMYCKHIIKTEMVSTHDGMCNHHHRCISCTSMISLCQDRVCSTCVLAGALRHSASTWTFLVQTSGSVSHGLQTPFMRRTRKHTHTSSTHLLCNALNFQLFTFNLSWPRHLWTSQTAPHFQALTPSK